MNAKIENLKRSETCMPIQIISLAREISESLTKEKHQKIFDRNINSSSAFVRRAMITSARFSESQFSSENIQKIRELIVDKDAWVAYDVIWLLHQHNLLNAPDVLILQQYANKYEGLSLEQLEAVSAQEAEDYRDKMAAEILLKDNYA